MDKSKKETHKKKKQILLSEEEYETLKKDREAKEELQDKLLRLQAEFENVRKRVERDKFEYVKYANEDIIKGLINIVDDFERALAHSKKAHDFDVLHKGIEMILKHLEEFLAKKGLVEIESVGHAFDPTKHEALDVIVDETKEEDTVCEEIQKGYLLNGKVLRASAVKISKKSEINKEDV